jgi:beta-glucanase (GH16 family)
MLQACLVLGLLCSVGYANWIDPDTVVSDKTLTSFENAQQYDLVFSDEFNVENRYFNDGSDPKWTSINKNDYTNYAIHYYNGSLATTKDGFLNISTIIKDVTFDVHNSITGKTHKETKSYQSAMIQGWNKFCFTGGIVEISAKLPGRHDIGGLWPAMWLLGNLARATYVGSSNNMWPWSYDECDETLQHQQLISKCNKVHSHCILTTNYLTNTACNNRLITLDYMVSKVVVLQRSIFLKQWLAWRHSSTHLSIAPITVHPFKLHQDMTNTVQSPLKYLICLNGITRILAMARTPH